MVRDVFELLGHQNDPVFGLDPEGVLGYVNDVVLDTTGYTREQVLGHHMAEFVHPDDLARAAEVVAALQEARIGVGTRAAIYRIKHGDGSWIPLDITGSTPLETGPLAGWMFMVGRYPGDFQLHQGVAELLTTGAPTEEVLALLPEFGHWRHPGDPYVVLYTGLDGQPAAVGEPRAAELCLVFADESPWSEARASGVGVVQEAHELPADLREAAAHHGLAGCMAVPVADPLGTGSAVIVSWSTVDGDELFVHRYAIDQMTSALALIMQWRQHIADLERSARHDPLTGLANRSSFFHQVARAGSHGAALSALLYIDLDDFKSVNDRHGHAAGDAVLRESARRMVEAVPEGDVVARLGGDEFAVFCGDLASRDDAIALADRLVESLAEPIDDGDEKVRGGASIGIAVGPSHGWSTDAMVERADAAMYVAKQAGGNRWELAVED